MANEIRSAALLRGINVGGHRMIRKDELKAIFEGCGLSDVRTVLASGNVVFTSDKTAEGALKERIEGALSDALGYRVDVMVRTIAYLNDLVALDPFADVGSGDGHNYVTFLTNVPESTPSLPENVRDQYFLALGMNDREFFSVSYKPVTTRNWKTVVKLAAM